jgi:hypothetical protein
VIIDNEYEEEHIDTAGVAAFHAVGTIPTLTGC